MPMFLSDALDALLQFQQALDTSRSSGWLGSSPSGSGSYPPLNVFRQGDDIVVIAEVPGVRKSDLQLEVKGRTISPAKAECHDGILALYLPRAERDKPRAITLS